MPSDSDLETTVAEPRRAPTNAGTALEVFGVGLVSTTGAGVLMSLGMMLILRSPDDLKHLSGWVRGLLSVATPLTYIGLPAAAGFVYGLKRAHRLNPLFVFLGWFALNIAFGSTMNSMAGKAVSRSSPPFHIVVIWCAVIAIIDTALTLLGSYVQFRRAAE